MQNAPDAASTRDAIHDNSDAAPQAHVGYFLVDDGRPSLEARAAYQPSFLEGLRRTIYHSAAPVYIGGVALVSLVIWLLFLRALAGHGVDGLALVALGILAILPASELAVQLLDYVLTRILPPRGLPKMEFKEGLPAQWKTLVVVPMMLSSQDAIREDVDRLEARSLANTDAEFRFALLADFTDADTETTPADDALMDEAVRGIENLRARYGMDRFFLMARPRTWSSGEGKWIGWERKRGKIEELNCFLCAQSENRDANFLRVGEAQALDGIRFVITLDADTQLPHGSARRLSETLAHPLNRPVIGTGKDNLPLVARGYSIIQPMVSTALPSAVSTRFARFMTDARGADPYTHLISNVYQDLSGEGAYHGKGIYDLHAFERVLADRFPEATLLSHDLLEGSHIRVGLATDIELFDQFPGNYLSHARRHHRWIRGDWQISDWASGTVATAAGKRARNPLSALNKWKIFDNLRRSLVPAACLLLLVAAWIGAPAGASSAGKLIGFLFALPPLIGFFTWLTWSPISVPFPAQLLGNAIARTFFNIALLPHQALLSVDAIARVLWRRFVSHRNLLEWQTAQSAESRSKNQSAQFVGKLSIASAAFAILALALALRVLATAPSTSMILPPDVPVSINVDRLATHQAARAGLWAALPFLALWFLAPLVISALAKERARRAEDELTSDDRIYLRQVARETWRYFDDFVGPQNNWLPPDNYQEHLNIQLAPRTSPTNIGLWLLAALSARDFGYLTLDQMSDRALATLESLDTLERHDGHFLNWYDTSNGAPLHPRYVSTVDSGNLLVCFWTLSQGVREVADKPVLDESALRGLRDTLDVFSRQTTELPPAASELIGILSALFSPNKSDNPREYSGGELRLDALIRRLRDAGKPAYALTQVLRESGDAGSSFDPSVYWADAIERQVASANSIIDRYLLWAALMTERAGEYATGGDLLEEALRRAPSLSALAHGEVAPLTMLLRASRGAAAEGETSDAPLSGAAAELAEAASKARWLAGEMLAQLEQIEERAARLGDAMNFRPLYNERRNLFIVGLNVEDNRPDSSYYELLASECRLASFACVARGEVPAEHWLKLRRVFAGAPGHAPALLSWSGTMFEYLMPLLLTQAYENSLLDYACREAVARQIAYGKRLGIPWGISEAAYAALDQSKTYQYHAFGVPGLGLKRGLEDDLVVAPYATLLALMVDAPASVENLHRLEKAGMRGGYGFYESIDYTRQRVPEGERGVPVRTFMVHHQGMGLLALDNVLNDNVMQERFHADPRVRATAPLLYEGVPAAPPVVERGAEERSATRLAPISEGPTVDEFSTPNTPAPRLNILGNGEYSLLVTNSGGGTSRWRDFEISRWRADTTRDNWGQWIYLRDTDDGSVWSSAFAPTLRPDRRYRAIFAPDRAEFGRRDFEIQSKTEITVSPDDNAEVRRLTLTNTSRRTRHIEATSFMELSLAPHNADRAHPAFSKLFVQTEWESERETLLATRRPRSPKDKPIWAAHSLALGEAAGSNNGAASTRGTSNGDASPVTQYETDRARFIGRGRDASNPLALESELSGTTGAVLDPVFSLRRRITLKPGESVKLAFVTVAAEKREEALSLAEKYSDMRVCERAFEAAWTSAQLEMYRLRTEPGDAQVFQHLASYLVYPHEQLRAPGRRLRENERGQSALWAHGISGDLPILIVSVESERDLRVFREVLAAHAFWNARGLKVDLVVLNEEAIGYDQPLTDQLRRLVEARMGGVGLDQPGGVFLRTVRQMDAHDVTLLLTVARAVLSAARGSLAQQMANMKEEPRLPARLVTDRRVEEEPSAELPFMDLPYFNGLGGFTGDGREYAIYLAPRQNTPAPWINALANERFGCLVSESNNGFSWCDNSQANRLTPWSNDAVSDTSHEAIYIRDDDSGTFWTPTPLPIRELDAYRTRHGQGYTVVEHNSHAIAQELITFVPLASTRDGESVTTQHPTVRVQRLKLRNASSRRRRLSVTFYAEWVLGTTREETTPFIVTQWDATGNLLLARNAYHPTYPRRVSFVAASPAPSSFTGDRIEFLGRNGTPARPAALSRRALSGRSGAGLDPCAALQTHVELAPGEETEIIFVLGQAENADEARHLANRFRDAQAFQNALDQTAAWWDDVLNRVQVETPDLSVNFLLNRWLVYQVLGCRVWGRSAFYQSGGAYGFRDQLQDVMALLHSKPEVARAQILRAAAHQFKEGDVLHWWHPPLGAGVRTRFADDLLWLVLVTAQYVRVTGDARVLAEEVPFIEGDVLKENEHETYMQPQVSGESATIFEHCRRAIERGLTAGPHGLPLFGIGDWNDGMSRVGVEGRGESVWMAWFLVQVLNDFAGLCELQNDAPQAVLRREQAAKMAATVEQEAWDGEWYRRGYFDDGSALGSSQSEEAKIDSLPQSWAILCGAGNPGRIESAMKAVDEHLIREDDELILLFTPPFDKSKQDPGYIKGYVPGVRENGGQYTHAAIWVAQAYARKGDGARAVQLLRMLNPIEHARNEEEVAKYVVEPYVVAADVYALENRVGRGGWTWYTGSASWMYRVWLEDVLGFQRRGDRLFIEPNVPEEWREYAIHYRHGASVYHITIENGVGEYSLEMDGQPLPTKDGIPLSDDGQEHHVRVRL